MSGLSDLHIEQFGKNGWFFAVHRTVSGLTLFAPTMEELASRLPGALALVLNAQIEDVRKAAKPRELSWHAANSNEAELALAQ
jgi:hypothetical protein